MTTTEAKAYWEKRGNVAWLYLNDPATRNSLGSAVAEAVAKGEIELGLTFLSEFVANPGVTIVGPFPSAIQSPTLYTAGLAKESANPDAARAFIAYVTSPNASAKLKALGVAPAH